MQVGTNWGGNYSRFTYDEAKRYFYMMKEQGVPVLDDEFNLLQEINITFLRRLIIDMFGDGSPNNGFSIVGTSATNDFTITGGDGTLDGAGHFYIGGYLITLPSNITYLTQEIPQLALTTPVANRTDKVYVDAYLDEIDGVEDVNIVDPVLGSETSRRLQLKYQIKVAEGGATPAPYVDANGVNHYTFELATISRTASALIDPGMVVNNYSSNISGKYLRSDIGTVFTGQYFRNENVLPQFQLFETGAPADEKMWKFSADNGALSFLAGNDADTVSSTWLQVQRTGAVVDSLDFTAGAINFNGITRANTLNVLNDLTDTFDNRVSLYGSNLSQYGMMLWNTSGTVGEWATMIYGPNNLNRRISFGKVNSAGEPVVHADITEGAYFDLDDWSLNLTGNLNAQSAAFVGNIELTGSNSRIRGHNSAGNFHLDANFLGGGTTGYTYINYYSGNGVYFGNGANAIVATMDNLGQLFSGPNKYWHAGNDGAGSGLGADLLDGYHAVPASYAANEIPVRDISGDLSARLFRSNYIEQTTAPATTVDIPFRVNNSTDNYVRFMTPGAFSTWCQNSLIKSYDSARLAGALPSEASTNSSIVKRTVNGYVFASFFNTTANFTSLAASAVMVETSADGYLRKQTPSQFATNLGLKTAAQTEKDLYIHAMEFSLSNWTAVAAVNPFGADPYTAMTANEDNTGATYSVGSTGGKLAISGDGHEWFIVVSPLGATNDVLCMDTNPVTTKMIAGTADNATAVSTTGSSWSLGASPFLAGESVYDIEHCFGNTWICLGPGKISISIDDGVTWGASVATIVGTPRCVGYANGLFYCGSYSGELFTSPDGVTWTQRDLLTTEGIYDVAGDGGSTLLATGYFILRKSIDNGVTWTVVTTGVVTPLPLAIAKYHAPTGMWILIGAVSIVVSTDLITWKEIRGHQLPTNVRKLDILKRGDRLSWYGYSSTGTIISNSVNAG